MAKIVNMKGGGSFSKDIITAVKGAAKKGIKRITNKIIKKARKGSKNPNGASRYRVNVPKSINRRLQRQKKF